MGESTALGMTLKSELTEINTLLGRPGDHRQTKDTQTDTHRQTDLPIDDEYGGDGEPEK